MSSIRQKALQLELQQVPYYVERWKEWVLVQELTGEERADLLQKCTEVTKNAQGKREGKVNIKRLYPMLAILSIRNPVASVLPERGHPHYAEYPGAVDEQGNFLTPPLPEQEQGEPAFSMNDLVPLNKRSGSVLETINLIAAPISGLRQEDIEEKKDSSGQTGNDETTLDGQTVESDGYTIE